VRSSKEAAPVCAGKYVNYVDMEISISMYLYSFDYDMYRYMYIYSAQRRESPLARPSDARSSKEAAPVCQKINRSHAHAHDSRSKG